MDLLYPSLADLNVRNLNKRILMDNIRFTPGGIGRADLARKMGLTRSAVTSIVNDLLSAGLIREAESGPATGGRRPILLEVNPKRGHVVGIDMGVTHLSMVVTDLSARVLDEKEIPFCVDDGPEPGLHKVADSLHDVLAKLHLAMDDIRAVGIGVPGPVVAESGSVKAPPVMPGWSDFPIQEWLVKLWRVPVSLNNDAELGALGEWAFGAGRGERNLAYIKVGSGVGAGLLMDGRIYRGATGCAGEIGHITIHDGGPRCTCGNYGCLEAVASGKAIAQRAQEAVQSGWRTQLAAITPTSQISAKDVAAAARLGDLVAQQILTKAGIYLGTAIASLVNLFNPHMVVVGGGVAQTGDLLLEPIRRTVQERSLRSAVADVRISAAVLGRRSSSMGAVLQALNVTIHLLTDKS